MRRIGWRLLFVLIVALAAFQIAFTPVKFRGIRPRWEAPRLHVNLGLDLQGGTYLVLEAQDTPTVKATDEAVEGAMRIIQSRIDQLGVVEPTIQRSGDRRIIVELPGVESDRAMRLIGRTALLEFVNTKTQSLPRQARWNAAGTVVTLPGPEKRTINLKKEVILTGADLAEAQAGYEQGQVSAGEPVVNFRFKREAAKKFEDYTASHVGQYLTIVLDNEVITSPVIRDRIPGGSGQISGGFDDITEARDLAVLLRAGALPVPVEPVETRTIGPSLGRDSLDLSLRAGAIAVVLVIVFMVLLYRLPGVLANLALSLYGLMLFAALTAIGATMTLPGMAAFVISVGMAIDANVLIFERIKEELRSGKTLRAAIQAGWNRAWTAILDSNVTTLVGAAVLFMLGTGPIKGFATTLFIGVVISLFTAIVITRILVDAVARPPVDRFLRFGA